MVRSDESGCFPREVGFSFEGVPVWLLELFKFCGPVFGSVIVACWSLPVGRRFVVLSGKPGGFSLEVPNPSGLLELVKDSVPGAVFSVVLSSWLTDSW
jgi:hypothetical protein